jgi:hypothetical protein
MQKPHPQPFLEDVAKMVVFGPGVVIGILALVTLVQIGLMSRNLPDNRSEWWGRCGAVRLTRIPLRHVLLFSCHHRFEAGIRSPRDRAPNSNSCIELK